MSAQNVKKSPKWIGLTGGIASGKSTVSAYLKQKGIPVIDSDDIVDHLWHESKEMIYQIKDVFGSEADRYHIASMIFGDSNKLSLLNKIVHPYVFNEIELQKEALKDAPFVFIDMPLLIEVQYPVDLICVVYVDEKTQMSRLMKRNKYSKEQAEARIKSQMPLKEKVIKADVVFDNNETKRKLYQQIDTFLRSLNHEA